jgi:hypothetical protein
VQRQAGPSSEVSVVRGVVAGEITAGKFSQRIATIHWRRLTEPIAHQDERVLSREHRDAHDQAANGRQH